MSASKNIMCLMAITKVEKVSDNDKCLDFAKY